MDIFVNGEVQKMIGTKYYKPIETEEKCAEYNVAVDWCNSTQKGIIEDKGEYYEVVEIPAPTQEELNAMEVERLKSELASTDYKCLKYVDGALTEEEYAEVKKYRADLRAKINELRTE